MSDIYYKPVVMCVGTVNVVGDSLGPKVGDILTAEKADAYVYGGTRHPVNGINYERYVELIGLRHPHSLTIAVDACLGEKKDIGKIKYSLNALRAGSALRKNLTSFGDMTVLCVVGEKTSHNFKTLLEADEGFIDSLAKKTAEKICVFLEDLRLNYTDRHKIV